jgi:hypothetical protein
MATITDFQIWLDQILLETQEEADDLIDSVANVTAAGDFATTRKHGKYYVEGPGLDILLLVNEKARSAFIAEVYRIGAALPDDLEAGFNRNMGKDNS